MQKIPFRALPLASAVVITTAVPAALGQDRIALEEVVVMAQRTAQNLQEVPISVTAVGGEALDLRQIDGFDQLQYVVPGMTFGAGVNARQSASTIRGIGTGLFNIGIEGSVAMAVDGVILGREGAGLFDLADVERVEVLRGPQGTLFGKNASAGVISIITRKPTDTFEADIKVAYGSRDELNLSGAVSGPLGDRMQGRLSAYSNQRDGYLFNVNPDAPQRDLNERDEYGMRGKLAINLSADADLMLSVDYAKRDQAAGALTLRAPSPGGPGSGLLNTGVPVVGPLTAASGIDAGPKNRELAADQAFVNEMESRGLAAELNWRIGDFELVSLTAWRAWDSFDNNDADLIPQPFLAVNLGDLEQEQFSQELRLLSPRDQRLTYTLGAYWFEQDLKQFNTQAGTAGLDLLGALPPELLLGTDMVTTVDETNLALFGQGEYALTDQLSVIAGARVLRSEISGDLLRTVTPGSVGPYAGQSLTPEPLQGKVNDNAIAWRLGLQYFLSDETNVFATISRGYKSGGVVSGLTINGVGADGTALPTVDAEIPLQYELGVRSEAWGGRLTTNLTAFYSTIDDFQAQALVPAPDGTTVFSVTNAGEAESWGFEGELTVQATDALTLSLAAAYTRATFEDFTGAPCYALQPVGPGGCTDADGDGRGDFQDLSGGDLANAPEWVVNALGRYEFDLLGLQAFTQVGASHRDDTLSSNSNDPNTRIGSYTLVDAQLGVNFSGGRGTVAVFGRNLFDEDFVEAIVGQPFDTGGYAQFRSFEAMRSFGVRLSMSY